MLVRLVTHRFTNKVQFLQSRVQFINVKATCSVYGMCDCQDPINDIISIQGVRLNTLGGDINSEAYTFQLSPHLWLATSGCYV